MKRPVIPSFLFVLLVLTLMCTFIIPSYSFSADVYWTDSIILYPQATSVSEAIRTITNGNPAQMNVIVEYYSSVNISKLDSYRVYGNGTEFVIIANGVVTKDKASYVLDSNEQLVLNVMLKPKDDANETVCVVNKISQEEISPSSGVISVIHTPEIEVTFLESPLTHCNIVNYLEKTASVTAKLQFQNKKYISQNVAYTYRIRPKSSNQTLSTTTGYLLLLPLQTENATVSMMFPFNDNVLDLTAFNREYILEVSVSVDAVPIHDKALALFTVNSQEVVIASGFIFTSLLFVCLVGYLAFARTKMPQQE